MAIINCLIILVLLIIPFGVKRLMFMLICWLACLICRTKNCKLKSQTACKKKKIILLYPLKLVFIQLNKMISYGGHICWGISKIIRSSIIMAEFGLLSAAFGPCLFIKTAVKIRPGKN